MPASELCRLLCHLLQLSCAAYRVVDAMAAQFAPDDFFNAVGNEDIDDDDDVLGMCTDLVRDATTNEAAVPTTHIEEPGAILTSVNNLADTIHTTYPLWPSVVKRLALGALVMYKKRFATDIGVHEHAHILHAMCGHFADGPRQALFGSGLIRAHNGSAYTAHDGAWRRHKGLVSEGLLATLKESMLALEGLFVWLHENNIDVNSDIPLLQAVNGIYTAHVGISDAAFISLVQDKARHQQGFDENAKKFNAVAVQVKKWSAAIHLELMSKHIFAMYGAWCSTDKNASTGVCWRDCCVLFSDTGINFVHKSPSHNIYTYIDAPLKDPVLQAHVDRLSRLHATTYWKNKAAFRSELSALCLALMGQNIDRGYFHLGRGGAGQSMTTAWFHALLAGLHAFLDMNIYFSDDEMRKQGELLIDMLVGTGQESVQGSASSLRFDLFKKHLSGDPVAMRLLYSIITKMEALVGWKRYECNILPTFQGVTENNFESVMRRMWVMQMRATFVDQRQYATIQDPESKGVFLKDPTARDFIVSEPAKAAGWKIVHGWMMKYTAQQCRDEIESYVDGYDKGLTRRCARLACGLDIHQPALVPVGEGDAADAQLAELQAESDALVGYLLANDLEYMSEAHCRLATCIKGVNPAQRKERFKTLVSRGLWKASVKPQGNAGQTYIPMLKTEHQLGSLYPQGIHNTFLFMPEHLRFDDLKAVFDDESRKRNVQVHMHYLEMKKKAVMATPRLSKEGKQALDDLERSARKIQSRETQLGRTVEFCEAVKVNGENYVNGMLSVKTKYSNKYDRMCRMYPASGGYSGMSKVMQRVANPNVVEFDQEAAEWTFLPQIVDRVQPLIKHEVALLRRVREFKAMKDEILASVSPDPVYAKSISIQVLNGSALPAELANHDFLKGVRKEGRFMRWLASSLDPSFHSQVIEEGEKSWPEATTLFYVWTGAEAWCTSSMTKTCEQLSPKHLSLHCDGIKMGEDDCTLPEIALCNQMQDAVQRETGYAVTIIPKKSIYALDLMKQSATSQVAERCDVVLLKEGNCIPAAIYFCKDGRNHIVSELKKINEVNGLAADMGARTYRDCQQLCKCKLRRVTLDQVSIGKSYVMHVDNGAHQKAVRLTVTMDNIFHVTDGGQTWTVPSDAVRYSLSKAVDFSSLVFFELLPHNAVLIHDEVDDVLLDLNAGGNGRTTQVAVKAARKTLKRSVDKRSVIKKRFPHSKLRGKVMCAKAAKSSAKLAAARKKRAAWTRKRIALAKTGVLYTPSAQRGARSVRRGGESLSKQHTLDKLLSMSNLESLELQVRAGYLKDPKHKVCGECGARLGKVLMLAGGRHPTQRCSRDKCRTWTRVTEDTWADHKVPLQKLAGLAFLASGQLSATIHARDAAQLVGVSNKTCSKVLSDLGDVAAQHSNIEQKEIKLKGQCEADVTTVRTVKLNNGRIMHIRYFGCSKRGDRKATIVHELPTYTTLRGTATRPESNEEVDGLMAAHTGNDVIIWHTDGARCYRSMKRSTRVKHSRKIWCAVRKVKMSKNNILLCYGGTQLQDGLWKHLKGRIPSQMSTGEPGSRSAIKKRVALWAWRYRRGNSLDMYSELGVSVMTVRPH